MCDSVFEVVMTGVVKDWIREADEAIKYCYKEGVNPNKSAKLQGGCFKHVPENITVKEFELEVLPEIKENLGL